MGNPILIKKESQKGKVKPEINAHPSKAWNRAIVDPPRIAIFIQYLIEDGIPPDAGGDEVTNEKGREKDDDVRLQAKIPKRSVLTSTKHGHEPRARITIHGDACLVGELPHWGPHGFDQIQ
jgi:hypothetical protein